jgi:dihydroflavonol-4-reductase
VTDQYAVDLLIQNANVIIHCASLISVGNQEKKEIYNINVNGTKYILKACQDKNIRFIYISSSAAVKETIGTAVFDENRPYKTENDFNYDWSKAVSEQLVLEAVKTKNLDAIILRPTAIVGPPDLTPSYFGQTIMDLASLKIPFIISGGYNLVDVRDVSQTIINSIDLGVSGEIYLVGGSYFSLKQILKIVNSDRKYVRFPLDLIILLLPIIKMYQKIFTFKWLITKESLMTLKRAPKKVDSSKAVKYLNHQIRPGSETINNLMEWFKKEKENELRNV